MSEEHANHAENTDSNEKPVAEVIRYKTAQNYYNKKTQEYPADYSSFSYSSFVHYKIRILLFLIVTISKEMIKMN